MAIVSCLVVPSELIAHFNKRDPEMARLMVWRRPAGTAKFTEIRNPGSGAAMVPTSKANAEIDPDTAKARELDVTGLHCPLPILRTRALLDRMAPGEELVVRATDPASVIDFRHFCNTTANILLGHEVRGDLFIYHIRRGG
jgi:tRNA 2-thiouridine synthesizing protein A